MTVSVVHLGLFIVPTLPPLLAIFFFFVLPRFIEGVMEGNNGVWERGLDEGKKVGNRECVM